MMTIIEKARRKLRDIVGLSDVQCEADAWQERCHEYAATVRRMRDDYGRLEHQLDVMGGAHASVILAGFRDALAAAGYDTQGAPVGRATLMGALDGALIELAGLRRREADLRRGAAEELDVMLVLRRIADAVRPHAGDLSAVPDERLEAFILRCLERWREGSRRTREESHEVWEMLARVLTEWRTSHVGVPLDVVPNALYLEALAALGGPGPHDRADCPCGHPAAERGACAGCNCADERLDGLASLAGLDRREAAPAVGVVEPPHSADAFPPLDGIVILDGPPPFRREMVDGEELLILERTPPGFITPVTPEAAHAAGELARSQTRVYERALAGLSQGLAQAFAEEFPDASSRALAAPPIENLRTDNLQVRSERLDPDQPWPRAEPSEPSPLTAEELRRLDAMSTTRGPEYFRDALHPDNLIYAADATDPADPETE